MTSDQRATPTPAAINRNARPTSIATGGRHQSERPAAFFGIRIERLYAASLVTAEATVRAILSGSPDQVSLVAMGDNGLKRTDEDELCEIHLRNRLEGRPGDADAIRRLILAGGEVGRFHDPARPYLHPADVAIALDI